MDPQQLIGLQIDQYKIISHIAQGGMADVYLAEDVTLKRKVAFKVLSNQLARDEQFVKRFQREARIVASLDHPNIVQVYSTGLTPYKQPYIAMQYVSGGSLRDLLQEWTHQRKVAPTAQALAITRHIAEALDVAHKSNIVHRDLKPSNVLIRADGTPVLVDLGIASMTSADKLTQTGSLMGTPHYMSPEQIRGERVDGRADLYSLGVILYELLAGIRPFDADQSIAVLHKHVYEAPTPLEQKRGSLAPQTLQVVATCLEKDPNNRYPSAAALAAAIDMALTAEGTGGYVPRTTVLLPGGEGELISKPSATFIPSPPPQQKERNWLLWGGGVTAVIILLLIGYTVFGNKLVFSNTPTLTITPSPTQSITETIPASPTPTTEITSTPLPTATAVPPTATPIPTNTPSVSRDLTSNTVIAASDQAGAGQDTCRETVNYFPNNLTDGDPTTAWRVEGDGIGTWLQVTFDKEITLESIEILPGYKKVDPCNSTLNWCPKNRIPQMIRLETPTDRLDLPPLSNDCVWHKFDIDSWQTNSVKITILDSYPRREDHNVDYTTISEIKFIGR